MDKILPIKKISTQSFAKKWLKTGMLVLAFLLLTKINFAQQTTPPPTSYTQPVLDTLRKTPRQARRDSIVFAKHAYFSDSSFSPRKATIRSALVPGWGQIYNKQYWKLPFVYAAVGITAGFYISNRATYREFKNAYYIRVADTGNLSQIPAELAVYSTNSLKNNRDQFRKYSDLSIIAFFIAWGVNVIDATVTAHLKQFDVSDNLSLKINPNINFLKQPGLTFVLAMKDKNKLPTLRSK